MTLPTLAELRDASLRNAQEANGQVMRLRTQLRDLMPGAERDKVKLALSNASAEHAHWVEYAQYYRQRCANEGEQTTPVMKLPKGVQPTNVVPIRPVREREPGEDDLEAVPF
jgi:hypothetical protein